MPDVEHSPFSPKPAVVFSAGLVGIGQENDGAVVGIRSAVAPGLPKAAGVSGPGCEYFSEPDGLS